VDDLKEGYIPTR